MNRRLTSPLTRLHFALTVRARDNLLLEGIPEDRIFVTGNTMVDALLLETATRLNVSAYDWIDDYRLFEDLPSAVMDTRKWLLEKADFVFASSRHLYEKACNLRPSNTVDMLSNGVDLDQQNFPGTNSGMKHSLIFLLISDIRCRHLYRLNFYILTMQ